VCCSDDALEDEKEFVVLSQLDLEKDERSLEGSRKRAAPTDVEVTEPKRRLTSGTGVALEV